MCFYALPEGRSQKVVAIEISGMDTAPIVGLDLNTFTHSAMTLFSSCISASRNKTYSPLAFLAPKFL